MVFTAKFFTGVTKLQEEILKLKPLGKQAPSVIVVSLKILHLNEMMTSLAAKCAKWLQLNFFLSLFLPRLVCSTIPLLTAIQSKINLIIFTDLN